MSVNGTAKPHFTDICGYNCLVQVQYYPPLESPDSARFQGFYFVYGVNNGVNYIGILYSGVTFRASDILFSSPSTSCAP